MKFSDITIQNIGRAIKGKVHEIRESDRQKRAEAKAVRDMYNEQYAVARKKALAEELSKQAQVQARLQAKATALRLSTPQKSGLARFFSPQAVNPNITRQLNMSMSALMGGNPVMNPTKKIEQKLRMQKPKSTILNINGTRIEISNPQPQHRKKVNALKSQMKKGTPNKDLNDMIWKL